LAPSQPEIKHMLEGSALLYMSWLAYMTRELELGLFTIVNAKHTAAFNNAPRT